MFHPIKKQGGLLDQRLAKERELTAIGSVPVLK